MFVEGNMWNCSENFSWILENNPISSLIADAEQLVCKFPFKDKPLKQIMLMIHVSKHSNVTQYDPDTTQYLRIIRCT